MDDASKNLNIFLKEIGLCGNNQIPLDTVSTILVGI